MDINNGGVLILFLPTYFNPNTLDNQIYSFISWILVQV